MCLPLINSPDTLHGRDEPSYLLYKKQTQCFFTATQTAKPKWKEGQLPPPRTLQSIKRGLCFITFPWGLQKFCKEFFDYCNTFINKRKWTPATHCTVRSVIIRGENNEGWAEIHARMHSSARLPFFPGKIDAGPTGGFLSAASKEKGQHSVHIPIIQYTVYS